MLRKTGDSDETINLDKHYTANMTHTETNLLNVKQSE